LHDERVVEATRLLDRLVVVVPHLRNVFFRTMRHQEFPLTSSPVKMAILVDGALIDARHEAGFRAEVRCDVQILKAVDEAQALAKEHGLVMLAELVDGTFAGRTHVPAIGGVPVLVDVEQPVDAADAVEVPVEFATGEYRAYV